MAMMVFIPIERGAAVRLRDSGMLTDERPGYAATAALMRAHGYDAGTLEDAEFAALTYAGVRAALFLGDDPLRLVVAAELDSDEFAEEPDDPYGLVTVRQLRWADVAALFADEASSGPAVLAARGATAGQDLASVLNLPAVEILTDDHDLLWFAPEELSELPRRSASV